MVAAAVILVSVSGCTLWRPSLDQATTGPSQTGRASWYGPGFHGKRTASGERFDKHAYTAAHRTLPHGTRVRVTNLANGRSVTVRINDRGPFARGRVLDLSYAAARDIGMIGTGTAQVRMSVLGPQGALDARASRDLPRARFVVQVASFQERARAERLRAAMATRFPDAHITSVRQGGHDRYRVRLGPYPDRGDAEARGTKVSALGYPALVMEHVGP
jgi:rare lipoprotein A